MDLPCPCAILGMFIQQASRFCHHAREDLDTNRKIRTPNESGVIRFNDVVDMIELLSPASGPNNGVHTERGEAFYVPHYCVRCGKLNGNIHASESFLGKAFEVGVVVLVELRSYLNPEFWRKLLDQPSHLAVSDKGDLHA